MNIVRALGLLKFRYTQCNLIVNWNHKLKNSFFFIALVSAGGDTGCILAVIDKANGLEFLLLSSRDPASWGQRNPCPTTRPL